MASEYTQYIKAHSKEEAEELIKKDPCHFCSLKGNPFCNHANGYGNKKPTFMVVSDFIRRGWITTGKPFSGPMMNTLMPMLGKIGINIEDIYWTSMVKCAACKDLKKGEDKAPKKEVIKFCSTILDKEIKTLKPTVIIACGQTTLEFFFPKQKMAEKRCQVLWSEEYQCNVVPIYNPEAMAVTYEFDAIIYKAFEQAYNSVYYPQKLQMPPVKYLKVKDLDMLRQVAERIKQVDRIAYDLETNSITYTKAKILSVGVSWAKNTGVSWPLWVKDEEACNKLLEGLPAKEKTKMATKLDHDPIIKKYWKEDEWDEVMRITKDIFETTECKKGGHNTFFDNLVLHFNGIDVKNYCYDTMVMKHLLDEEREKSLDYCSWIYTDKGGYKMAKEKYLKSDNSNYANIPLDVLLEYNAGDAAVTYELYDVFKPEILKQNLTYEMGTIRMPLQKALMEACIKGMRINRDYLHKLNTELTESIEALNEKILVYLKKYYGEDVHIINSAKEKGKYPNEFNINGADNLSDLLFKKMKLKSSSKTNTGKDSTDESALLKLARNGNEIADLILQRKKKFKFKTTYVDGMEDFMDENDRIHPSFNITGTETGRLSCSNPNCFDDKTEVLTNKGWKLFRDLDKTELLAQWSNNKITFAKPLDYVSYKYTGDMVHLHNQHTDICVTPDHNCMLLTRSGKQVFSKAVIYPSDHKQIHGGVYCGGNLEYSPEMITLIAATQADGYYKKDGMIEFVFTKQRKYLRLLNALTTLGAGFTNSVRSSGKMCIRLKVNDKFNRLVKEILPNKEFTYDLLNLTESSRNLFIKELDYWDGCLTRPLMYVSKSYQNIQVLQALLALNNRRSLTRIQEVGGRQYYRFESTKDCNYSYTTNIQRDNVSYDGMVYCVTMPEHTVVVKRCGKVVVTGQCQQIPRDKSVKSIFEAPDGYELMECDFSQAELRVLAALSNDVVMKRIYEEGRDLHMELAMSAFNKPASEIDKEQRTVAKTANFLICYGGGAKTLQENLVDAGIHISEKEAQRILDTWHSKFKDASSFLEACGRRYLRDGILINPFGRRRRFLRPFTDEYINSSYKRIGSNAVIQGTAAELAFLSLINISREVKKFGGQVISTVHDSIIIEYPKDQRKNIAQVCKKYTWVTYPFLNGLYMKSDCECDKVWGHKKEINIDTGEYVEKE